MKAKERYRARLLEHLANPENEIPNREGMASICRIKRNTLYLHFSPGDLSEIEKEALEIRRKTYSSMIASVDKALFKAAEGGDVQAIKLVYQRFEGWSEKRNLAVDVPRSPIVVRWANSQEEVDANSY